MNKKVQIFLGSLVLVQLCFVRAGQTWSSWGASKVESQTQEKSVLPTDDFAILSKWQDPDSNPAGSWNQGPDELPDPATTSEESNKYGYQGYTIRMLQGTERNGALIDIAQNGLLIKTAIPNNQEQSSPHGVTQKRGLLIKAATQDNRGRSLIINAMLNKQNSDQEYPERLFFHHARDYQIIIEDPIQLFAHSISYPDIRLCCLSERGDIGIAWKYITQNTNGQITRDDYVSFVPFAAIESNNKINLYEQKTINYLTEEEVNVGNTISVYQFQKLLFNAIASKLGVVFNTWQQEGNNPSKFLPGPGDLKTIDILSEISTCRTAKEILQSKFKQQENNNNNNNNSLKG